VVNPEDGVEVARGQIGEVLVRGPTVMKGYWNNHEGTRNVIKEDGWLHTNDMGRMDEEGYLFLVGRKDDMIVSGGEKIHPSLG